RSRPAALARRGGRRPPGRCTPRRVRRQSLRGDRRAGGGEGAGLRRCGLWRVRALVPRLPVEREPRALRPRGRPVGRGVSRLECTFTWARAVAQSSPGATEERYGWPATRRGRRSRRHVRDSLASAAVTRSRRVSAIAIGAVIAVGVVLRFVTRSDLWL